MHSDVVIVGGGPGGSACAMFLLKAGIQPTVIEKMQFPRYHIGESMTGECGNCVRALGLEAEMLKQRHPVKWGVVVYGPNGRNRFHVPVMGRDDDGKLFPAYTWQVRRSEFDEMLFNAARERGANVIHGEAVAALRDGEAVRGVRVRCADGTLTDIESKVVVDASGLATFLSGAQVTGRKDRGNYDNQVAIFSQVKGAVRDEGPTGGDTLIFYQRKHHWAWFIPLDDEVVSVGVVVPSAYFQSKKESKHDFLVRELHTLNPELKRRLPTVDLIEEARAVSNYSYHIRNFTGPGYLAVGDAHRFIDPVFSFGLYFSLREAQDAATTIVDFLAGGGQDEANPFAAFERRCNEGMDVIQEVIDAFWNEPLAFALIVHDRHTADCIDMFAGRVYMDEPSAGLVAFRKVNEASRRRAMTAAVG